jgi:membrane protein DedA with SNARE-associated domain
MSPSKKSRPARRRKPRAAASPARPRADLRTILLRLAGLVLVIGITAYVYTIRMHVKEFAAFGYPGIFLVMLLANATVIIPAPGLAVVFAMGGIFNPLGVAVAGGTGGALGELTGYLAGLSGQAVIEKADIYNRVHPWVEKYGGWAVLVLAAIPNPFFDLAGIAAGATKMTFSRFLLFCWIGQLIKMSVFAFAGAYSLDWILNLTAR